jgi:alpha-tubulin suppressor-like RCC1 family protein
VSTPGQVLAEPGVPLEDVVDVVAGDTFTCALQGDGTVSCFGSNDDGELGNGGNEPSPLPVPVQLQCP